MKKILYFLFIYLTGFNATAQIVLDEDEFKNLSNREFIEFLDGTLTYFNWMERVMSFGSDEDRDLQEEKIIPAYQLDTIGKIQSFRHFLDTHFSLWQEMSSEGSDFKVTDDNYFSSNFDKELLDIRIDELFFSDGSTEKSEEELDLTFRNKIKTRKAIDSIRLHVSIDYVTDFDVVELNKTKKTATYDGKSIQLEKLDANYLLVSYNSELHPFLIEGLNAKKEVLDDYQYMTSDTPPDEARKMYEQIRLDMRQIREQATADSAMTQAAFQAKYLPRMNKFIKQYFPETGIKFKEFHYYGNVDGARLYFAKKQNTLEGKNVIKNNNPQTIFIDYPEEGEGTILYDKSGNLVYREAKEYRQLNAYFYEDDMYFYHLNLAAKKMEPALYYDLEALDDNYAMARYDEDAPYYIVNNNNQLEIPNRFRKIGNKGNIIYAINQENDSILFITDSGAKKWMENITHISDFVNGYAFVRQDDKFGFIDNQANLVIPIVYDDAEGFDSFDFYTPEDKLFIVKKGDLWGAVNATNKVVIPFMYKELKPFSYGITLAQDEKSKWGLIDTKNKTIAPFMSSSYSLSTNFGKRKYYLNEQDYDYLGCLEGLYEYRETLPE